MATFDVGPGRRTIAEVLTMLRQGATGRLQLEMEEGKWTLGLIGDEARTLADEAPPEGLVGDEALAGRFGDDAARLVEVLARRTGVGVRMVACQLDELGTLGAALPRLPLLAEARPTTRTRRSSGRPWGAADPGSS
ncbi:MAG: hypothetical protein VYE73_10085 [Acidobacteriota bacterium]|nr:hypothetical protein [Acidobacteriota bacterium]